MRQPRRFSLPSAVKRVEIKLSFTRKKVGERKSEMARERQILLSRKILEEALNPIPNPNEKVR